MLSEEQLKQAMRATAHDVQPPVSDLVTGGIGRGRRRRGRRMAAMTAGALAAGVVLAGGLVFTPGPLAALGGGGPTAAGPASDGTDDGGDVDEGAPDTENGSQISSDRAMRTLIDLLPEGEIADRTAYASGNADGAPSSSAGAAVVYDDGHGASTITVSLGPAYDDPGCMPMRPSDQCTEKILGDESILSLVQDTYGQAGLMRWGALLSRPDGLQIVVWARNAVGEKEVPPTRAEPPLTMEQLEAVVTSDRWQSFELSAQRRAEIADERAASMAASETFADDLGAGWVPPEHVGAHQAIATPVAENADGLPSGYTHVRMERDAVRRTGQEFLRSSCAGRAEKARQWDPCVEMTTAAGEDVMLQWSRSTDETVSVPTEALTVKHLQGEDVVRVTLTVKGSVEASTPDRRAAVESWIEEQADAMIAAATADRL